ncbi:AAA family ATPase [Methylobacterium sp. WL12]|uniref:AAA family ATPase n=1 Tax=Methylobacterium sp. WL12 TaxID=2603890 RepID=UPI00164F5145|nr:AAA family ATPase [Methylobacterium sp. WL12]
MSESTFADKYRPERFSEVFGQESVVTCLSGLIQRGQIGRHVLLHGSVGSGKTSLARLYARALNCEAPEQDGSPCCKRCITCSPCETPSADGAPCGRCPPCKKRRGKTIAGFHEYNVSRRGGELAQVRAWAADLNQDETEFNYRVLFFDEAQVLTREACDALLDHVERPARRVLFFFATTEVERVREALRSRLFDLMIRPLPLPAATTFLRFYAEKQRVDCEPGALALLAGLRKGYPRDLLLGLDRVYERGNSRLTVRQVRDAFDIDQTEMLVAYFRALADGDLTQQTELLFGWRESAADRIRWIKAFLISLYYNNIQYRRVVVDGLIEAIPESARTTILDGFCQRLGLARHAELEPAWRRMLEFWPVSATEADETALGLRVALFHRLVNAGLTDASEGDRPHRHASAPNPPARDVFPTVMASSGFGPPVAFPPCPGADVEAPGFVTVADVRQIINRASFLIQEHRVFFNIACEIRPVQFGVRDQDDGIALIAAFPEDLARQAAAWGGEHFASLTLLERDALGLVGRVVVYVPRPTPFRPTEVDCLARAEAWARDWRGAEIENDSALLFEAAAADEAAALAFHWTSARTLCGGLDPDLEVWDPASAGCRPLGKMLKVKPRKSLGPVFGHPLVSATGLLSDPAIAAACRNRLEPISAFDDRAWTRIVTGWEREEFEERSATREERERELADMWRKASTDATASRAALEACLEQWPADPRARRRRWRGWWGRG